MKTTGRPKSRGGFMLIEERRQHVLSQIQRDGRVLVSELSDALGISRITIRKDLDNLESRGLVTRTHGGALAAQHPSLDPPVNEKHRQRLKEKQRIAEAAAKLTRDGDCILLDSGTTTTAVAHALRRLNQLTIITNGVNIAADLANTNFEIILLGGVMRKGALSIVGPSAEDMLREIRADILFLGVDGFDSNLGITTPNVLEARVNRAMVQAARRVVAVCDSTKFTRRSLAKIVPTSGIHAVITDDQISKKDLNELKNSGVDVILV
ncbi:MAG TPA: transcriptional repressor AgaR [Edaphobacter sp.]|nr:transcriptional repressor AgaR [Edaphobacter sp.]